MKILVTGAAGYLGAELCRQALARGDDVLAAQHVSPPPYGRAIRLDVRDEDAVHRTLMRHGPHAVFHTAYVQADADTIVRGSASVAAAAHRCSARLVHLSTDLVFDGEHGAPYTEDDEPRPVMAYGAAKLEAEGVVLRRDPDALVVRTSLLYGKEDPGPQERLAMRDDVVFYTDEIRSPTRVDELTAALLALAALDVSGPLHVAGPVAVSRADFAALLRGGPVRSGPGPASGRARNVALDSSRAVALLGAPLSGVGRSA
jgi:dTDP-4-dehydrorhamnose reductase